MSVEATGSGNWRVRWRDEHGRNRSRVVGPRKTEAVAFDHEIKRAKRLGTLGVLTGGNKTLDDFSEIWIQRHGRRQARNTRQNYAWIWDTYLLPRFGRSQLREITPADVEEWIADMEDSEVGRPTQYKAVGQLKQVLTDAVRWGDLGSNPVASVKRPSAPSEPVVPPTPVEVERIRSTLLSSGRLKEATIISMLAYAGLRPHELWALTPGDIGKRTITVRTTRKVGSRPRSVDKLGPLSQDLAEWRLASGSGGDVLFPTEAGCPWTETTFNNFRRRIFKRIAPTQRPYALRHTFVSLLIGEGMPVVKVAAQAGHSPEVCMRTYAHLWDELSGTGSAEDAIREARAEVHRKETVSSAR